MRIEFDINDTNWRISQVRCINNSEHPLKAFVHKSGVQVFTAVAEAKNITSWNTSGLQLGWQPDYYDSRDGQYHPDGLDMKDYTIQIQSPAGA